MVLRYLLRSFWVWFGLIWGIVGTPIFMIGGYFLWREYALASRGMAVEGRIAGKGHSRDSKGRDRYEFTYSFTSADGTERSGTRSTSYSDWSRVQEGDAAAVIHLPDRPDIHRLRESMSDKIMICVMLPLGMLFGGIGWYLVARAVKGAFRRARILRIGIPVAGQITSVETDHSVKINGRHPKYLTFSFVGPDGNGDAGQSAHLSRRMETRYQEGGTVMIYVNPANAQEYEADIMGLRRPGQAGIR